MLEQVLGRAGRAKRVHADEIAIVADEVVPALADCGFRGDLDRRSADDGLAISVRLFLEQFDAGNRDDAGRNALAVQFSCGLDGEFDLGAGCEDRNLGIVCGDQLIGTLAERFSAE